MAPVLFVIEKGERKEVRASTSFLSAVGALGLGEWNNRRGFLTDGKHLYRKWQLSYTVCPSSQIIHWQTVKGFFYNDRVISEEERLRKMEKEFWKIKKIFAARGKTARQWVKTSLHLNINLIILTDCKIIISRLHSTGFIHFIRKTWVVLVYAVMLKSYGSLLGCCEAVAKIFWVVAMQLLLCLGCSETKQNQ